MEQKKGEGSSGITNGSTREQVASKSPGDTSTTQNVQQTTLKRSLGLFGLVSLLLSISGHVSIFITPGIIIGMAGSLFSTVILWCLGSVAVYTMALCFTEMATIYPKAGGPYLYVTQTFGNLAGFLIAWSYIGLLSGPFLSFCAQTASLYIVTVVAPGVDCDSLWFKTAQSLLAGWIILTLCILNCNFFHKIVKLQSIFTFSKMIAIALIIVTGLVWAATKPSENFNTPLAGSHFNPGALSMGFVFVIFSLGGWQNLCSLAEEAHNPARTMPRAMHIGFATLAISFMLTYVSYTAVLGKEDIIRSRAIALLFCEHVWPPLGPVMSILVSLACIGALNGGMMGHSRIIYAAARKGDTVSIFNTLDPVRKTPTMAVLALTLYALILTYSGHWEAMMKFIGLFSLLMSFKVISGLLYLRYTKPSLKRPYKVPTIFAVVHILLDPILFVLIIYQSPATMSIGCLIYLSGIPAYLIFNKWENKHKTYLAGQLTRFCQKLFLQVP